MTTLYDRIAGSIDGARRLAVSRLKHEALRSLHIALETSGISQNELAKRLHVRKSAVSQTLRGDGNLRVKTIAEYLHALGFELDIRLVRAGEPRKAITEGRDVRPAFSPAPVDQHLEQPGEATPVGAASLHAVDMGSDLMLLEMTIQGASNPAGPFRFEGSALMVSKPSARPRHTPPSEFKPLRPLAMK
ncbi:helix-turn-helix transcriptional regulator [Kitasatospora sp. MAP5-34]|uniref:helix-turn-helix domain-containing protein n=1 Tax=Kitasatospora sp. MAP5-34 TaxID=3035102 RepID=UPI0024733E28|nr:helix-turn-helix transcriptional regulator [Kitasatospora sp. MAP5-34]MDH6577569.1 transcriptional regulator with XRE-family HTH domain [Kitasatospora sp. MAP5-34]